MTKLEDIKPNYHSEFEYTFDSVIYQYLIENFIKDNSELYSKNGTILNIQNVDTVYEYINSLPIISKFVRNNPTYNSAHTYVMIDSNVLEINFSKTITGKDKPFTAAGFTVYGTEEFVNNTHEALEKFSSIKEEVHASIIYILTQQSNGVYGIQEVGKCEHTFVRENYTSDVVKGYDYIVTQLSSEKPNGKLFIIDGPPGTGKTHIIRGLLNDIDNCCFVLVNAQTMHQFNNGNVLRDVLNFKVTTIGTDTPLVFILEDADQFLIPREQNDLSIVSQILNLSDGILGELLDLRIVATTNGKEVEIDKALKRPGRLNSRLHVGLLPSSKASEIYFRETKDLKGPTFSNKVTLAEVYAAINGRELETYTNFGDSTKVKVGFGG